MRLLSVFVAAAIMAFGLAGVAAAQEESTGQAFETREMTGPEKSPTRPPTSGQNAGAVQASAECPGAVELGSIPPAGEPPTDEDLETNRPIPITGESFRLTYETTDAEESGFPFLDVTVLDQAGNEVGGQVISEESTVREIVRASPGRFDFEVVAEDLKYRLTIEDCRGGNDPGPPSPPPGGSGGDDGQPVPTDPIPEDQYTRDVDPPNEDVIDDTISDEPLPNTGGVPLLGVGFFGFICIYAAVALLRPVIRRDS
jgi:hypothetical protein